MVERLLSPGVLLILEGANLDYSIALEFLNGIRVYRSSNILYELRRLEPLDVISGSILEASSGTSFRIKKNSRKRHLTCYRADPLHVSQVAIVTSPPSQRPRAQLYRKGNAIPWKCRAKSWLRRLTKRFAQVHWILRHWWLTDTITGQVKFLLLGFLSNSEGRELPLVNPSLWAIGDCCVLHVGNPSSPIQPLDYHQETSLIDWCNHKPRHLLSRYPNEDEQIKRFNTHIFNCYLLHLKTMKVPPQCPLGAEHNPSEKASKHSTNEEEEPLWSICSIINRFEREVIDIENNVFQEYCSNCVLRAGWGECVCFPVKNTIRDKAEEDA
ncbi:hypothetical protein HAX54_007529 [Datura stramonium]|uniref:Uncharacterized protein n=1 Tax=Datura stramonium TaxID=4076 RepID=A0ABS8TD98_DATST|nr:hypothetical protein [Datura stramonium]